MGRDSLEAPYESTTIEAETRDDAIRRAKEWAATFDVVTEDSWLQVAHDGKSVASFKPGQF
jgi:hypothetical protein